MEISPGWMPNIHPFIVHFPIAILIIAVLSDLTALLLKKHSWLAKTSNLLYTIGTAFAVIAFISGRIAVDNVFIPADANTAVNAHSDWALRTTVYFTIFLIIRLGIVFKISRLKNSFKIPLFLAGAVGMFLLFETAEHGGKLVYEQGIGIKAVTNLTKEIDEFKIKLPVDPGIVETEEGSWFWQPVAGAEKILKEKFIWIEGSVEDVQPSVIVDSEHGQVLLLHLKNNSVLLVAGSSVENIQADLIINISEFKGSFKMIHHFQDKDNYDFVTLENGVMKLGRKESGNENILDQNPFNDSQAWLNVGVFGGGGHFRGIQDGINITHGHIKDLPPGKFGYHINGEGTIKIKNMKIQSIK